MFKIFDFTRSLYLKNRKSQRALRKGISGSYITHKTSYRTNNNVSNKANMFYGRFIKKGTLIKTKLGIYKSRIKKIG